MEEGMKYDTGKNRLELIPTELIDNVGQVLTFGAEKYEPNNWKKFTEDDYPRLIGAMMRHLEAYRKGEYYDPESGLPHLAHLATNAGFLLHLDDRAIDYDRALKELIDDIKRSGYVFHAVRGIARGGMIPAVQIAHTLNITDVASIGPTEMPDLPEELNVLIVDDICDSGETFNEWVKARGESSDFFGWSSAAVFKRHNSSFTPNFVGHVVHDDAWVVFPWETKESTLRS